MLYRLRNVKQCYNGRTVLDIPELTIEAKKIYTLLGPNGAGKTTLLKILALLDQPTEGAVEFRGAPVVWDKNLYRQRRHLVLLDQSPIMFSGSVSENVAYGLKVRETAKGDIAKRVRHALEIVGMEQFSLYDARKLSGGETKRVALARAIVLQPEVLLCDEPTANVDQENQEIILEILGRLKDESRTSIVFSTHYLSQSSRLAEQTLVLQNGQFVGGLHENVFNGTCLEVADKMARIRLDCGLEFNVPEMVFPGGEFLRLAIAADQVQPIAKDKICPADGVEMRGKVCSLERDGDWVRTQVDGAARMCVLVPAAQYEDECFGLGQELRLFVPFSSMILEKFSRL